MDIARGARYIGAMELMLLRTFMVVADVGGFTAAADRLCVTQSAVSRRIRQLEEHYGVPLLDRSTEPTRPTPAGAILLKRAARILDVENELEEAVRGLSQKQHIGFGCTPCFGTGQLPGIVERFIAAYGMVFDLKINFQMPEHIIAGVLSGQYGFAVIEHCDDLDLGRCVSYPLPDDEIVFVSAPGSGLPEFELTFERLVTERLFFKAENGCAHRFLRRSLALMGKDADELTNVSFYDDLPGVISQVLNGHGMGFISRSLAVQEIKTGQLRTHLLEGFDHFRPRSLLVSPHFKPTEITHGFVEMIFKSYELESPADFTPAGELPGTKY